MRRFFLCFFMIVLLPNTVQSASNFKVSFIRDGDVWIYENGKETKIPSSNEASEPVWSKNGSYIAYKNGKSLMAASVKGKQTEIEKNVQSYQWSPTGMELAYISNNILTIYNVKQKKKSHVALGVNQFSWFPDGEKFLITESATLSPRGWGAVKLYTVEKNANLDIKKVEPFATLPHPSDSFFAYTTSEFKWSENGHWISFLAIPTASMSADGNTLCVITSEGKAFQTIGTMLNVSNWFKWSPHQQELAFINGEGRIATENKTFTLKEMPVFKEHIFTPKGFADWDFTWAADKQIIISRVQESDWSNDVKKRPLPSLYTINLSKNEQEKLTNPLKGWGDYAPTYINHSKQTLWIRTNRKRANIMSGSAKQEKVLIKDIDVPANYYDLYRWSDVFTVYEP